MSRSGLPDGSNYPGAQSIRKRIGWLQDALKASTTASSGAALLMEYKPFEPAFYHTDVADWGMAASWRRMRGPRRAFLSTPATIIRPKTLSRSWLGSCICACSADFTSTIAAMRMMT